MISHEGNSEAAARVFPTHVAAQLTGVTPRTLLNWCWRDFVKPSVSPGRTGPGGERLYSFRDLVAIRVADVLRGLGIDVRHLPLVVDYIRKRDGLEVDQPLATDTYLVNDSRGFREFRGTVSIMEIRQGGIPEPLSVVLIPLGEFVNELQAKARALGLCAACERPFAASEARQPDGPPPTRSTTSSKLPPSSSAAAVLKPKRRKHADRR